MLRSRVSLPQGQVAFLTYSQTASEVVTNCCADCLPCKQHRGRRMHSLAGLCLSFPDLPGEEQTNYTSGEERVTSLLPVWLSTFLFHPIPCSWVTVNFTEPLAFIKRC